MRLTQPPFKIKPLVAWLTVHISMSMMWPITISFAAEVSWPVPIATPALLATAAANLSSAMTAYTEDPTPANAQALAQAQVTYNQAVLIARIGNPNATLTISDGNQDTINGNNGSANSFSINNQAAFIHATGDNTSLTILNHSKANFTSGGAILLNNGAIFDISAEMGAQIEFINNYATEYGGAIYNDSSFLSITNSTFNNNAVSLGGGGAIANTNGTLSLTNTIFNDNNVITASGGALYINNGTVSIANSTFNNNSVSVSGDGGAIYSSGGTLRVVNSIFSSNLSGFRAGAIYNFGTLSLIDSVFNNNTADNSGGAIYSFDSTLNLLTTANNVSQFTGNTANSQASSITLLTSDSSQLSSINAFIEAGGIFDMRDPMDSSYNPGTIVITQAGFGTWRLGGTNTFASTDSTGRTTFAVNEGQLYLYAYGEVANDNPSDPYALVTAGSVNLLGSQSIFTLGTGATLVASGENAISTEGSIVLQDGSLIRGGSSIDRDEPVDGITSTLSLNAANGISLAGNVTLAALSTDDQFTLVGNLTGDGALTKANAGLVILDGVNNYIGGTTVTAGILRAGSATAFATETAYQVNGGTLDLNGFDLTMSSLSGAGGNIALDAAVLTINQNSNSTYAGVIQGTGQLIKTGGGEFILVGNNTYTGATTIDEGTLLIQGNQTAATGLTTVNTQGTLGGQGILGGDVFVAGGALFTPNSSPSTLTIQGNLTLDAATLNYTLGQVNVVGGPFNNLISVGGNLVLDGTLNISETSGGQFDVGLYRLINYNGALTNNGLVLGETPAGTELYIQTAVANQINLVNTTGITLNFWDGSDPTHINNGEIDGGNGVWNVNNTSWTNSTGAFNAPYTNNAFAVFASAPGTVVVDNTAGLVRASGLQFAVDGYQLTGDTLTLTESTIAVGDGTLESIGMSATIASILDGDSGLTKKQLGTLVLQGLNTYSGGTTIDAGVLSVTQDANLGEASGALTLNGGTLQTTAAFATARTVRLTERGGTFDTVADFTLTQSVTGEGGLTKTGLSSLLLSSPNTYTGLTTIQEGRLALTLAGNIATSRGVNLSGSQAVFDVSDAQGPQVIQTLSGIAGSQVQLGSTRLLINQERNTTFAGEFLGQGGFTKQGLGTLELSGLSTNYTGTTWVESGELAVNGLLGGELRVNSGGRLSGSGTIGNTTVAGTIAPGNSIGTLTVAGNYVQTAGSVYDVEINPAGASDLINISGRATLQPGAGVSVLKTAGLYTPGTRYTILTAENGVVGTYSNLSQNLPFLDLLLNYDTNHVYLDIARNDRPFNSFAVTPNQAETAIGVESLGGGNGLYDAFVNLDNPHTIQTALNDLSGEIYASTLSALMEESRYVREAMRSRLDSSDTLAEAKTPMGLAFWAHGFGAAGQLEGNGNAATLDRSTQGFFIGADQAFGVTGRLGVMGGYSQSAFDVDSRHSYSESDNAHLGAYGRLAFNHLVASTGAAYSWHTLSTHRTVAFPGFTNPLNSNDDAHTAQVFGELGYELAINYLDMKPLVNVAYVDVKADNVTEQGGDARLRAHKARQSVWLSTLGVQEKGLLYQTDTYAFNHHVFLGWRHAYDNLTPKATFNFAAGSVPFFIGGVPIAQNALLIDAGLNVARLSNNLHLSVSYIGQYSNQVTDNGVAARLTWQFA